MDYKVEFKDSFLDDLELIVRGIAGENAEAARRLGEMIVGTCEALEFFPLQVSGLKFLARSSCFSFQLFSVSALPAVLRSLRCLL
jgi:hypothetical protein